MTDYQATIYPGNAANPTVANADAGRKPVAVCFSGGGSRALTCAWGQLLGLSTLTDAGGKPLLDEVRYISSVSGGSWAAVLYTFLPETVTYADFLGASYRPSQLYYNHNEPGGLNVSTMTATALGKIPQNFANLFEPDPLKNIIVDFITITALKGIPLRTSAKWLWMYIVGKNVLADFNLYNYKYSIFQSREITPWQDPNAKFFSLTKDYAEKKIFSLADAPPTDAFVYARTLADGRPAGPILIINTNIIGNACPGVFLSAPIQIPTQVSALSAGIYGANPCTADSIGGGSVESFAFTSKIKSLSGFNQILADFPRRYTLADITACSSAFYAATLADPLEALIAKLLDHKDTHLHAHLLTFVDHVDQFILNNMRRNLQALSDEIKNLSKEDFLKSLVPQYNYWPVNQVSEDAAANQTAEFTGGGELEHTDGGDLENTGVAGLLAQVQGTASHIIAFVNGSEVLTKKNGQIIAATQMAPLFGVAYDADLGQFKNYLPNGVNPFTGLTDPTGFLQVFDNSHAEFDSLRLGLYTTNGSGAKTDAAFCRQALTVIENMLLGIKQSYTVNVLWVQNAQVNHWQDQITDATLQQKIAAGQQRGGTSEFADFPYYDTFLKIHQTAAETNTLAQMWAWCVSNPASPLSAAIAGMFI